MTTPIKILLVAGARPNFMKIAPVIHAIRNSNTSSAGTSARMIDYRLVHTGQHYDDKMSDVFFRELSIPEPHENLGVGSGTHAVQTAAIMVAFEPVCLRERPDWVVVVGDVNSSMACTLVASKLHTPVAHIEAGLRSFDRTMPEEINRIVTDSLADLLLTPSADADQNLIHEGIPGAKIRRVGNVMIDSLIDQLPNAMSTPTLGRLGLEAGDFAYVTLHRPSNVDNRDGLRVITDALVALSEHCVIVFPIHPRTRARMAEFGTNLGNHPGIRLIDPIGYHDSLNLTRNARFILTDSGGLQEESTYFRTPCLTLRPNTERPITIEAGSNRLTCVETLHDDISRILAGPERIGNIPALWDGQTARRIVAELLAHSVKAAQAPPAP